MAKPTFRVLKSYADGHVKVRVTASAYGRGSDISAAVAFDLDLDAARAFQAELASAIQKEADKVAATQAREDRRKKWREREIAAGRMKIMSFGSAHPTRGE